MLGSYFNGYPVTSDGVREYVRLNEHAYLNYLHTTCVFYIDVWITKYVEFRLVAKHTTKNPRSFVIAFKQLNERINHAW